MIIMTNKRRTFLLLFIAGGIFLVWLLSTPPGLLGKADAVGFAVCHRIEVRSFHILERPIALCARCTGQYLGAVIAILYAIVLGGCRFGWPRKRPLIILVALFLAYAVDGLNSFMHLYPNWERFYLYEPNNTLRLFTGTGMGLVMGLGTWTMFQSVVWKEKIDEPVLSGFWTWAGLFLLAVGVDVLVLTGNPLFLYPLTLVSALGVLGLLTLLYTLIWVMVFRAENRFTRYSDFLWLLLAGFSTATLQILVMDLVRYWATGTWGGFHLG